METNDTQTVATETATQETETVSDNGSTPSELAEIKSMLETFNNDIASLKRSVKKASKPSETPQKTESPENSDLLERVEKMALRTAGITHPDDISFAQETAKKWNMDMDALIEDEDFQAKLTRQQTQRKNEEATSGVKGDKSGGTSGAKEEPGYWLAKGTPPSPEDVPDRKTRAKIMRAFMAEEKGTGKNPYYNGK